MTELQIKPPTRKMSQLNAISLQEQNLLGHRVLAAAGSATTATLGIAMRPYGNLGSSCLLLHSSLGQQEVGAVPCLRVAQTGWLFARAAPGPHPALCAQPGKVCADPSSTLATSPCL